MPQTLAGIFVFSFLIAIVAVVSPGPVSTTIVSQAPRRGWTTGPLVALGHTSLELILVILITFGLSRYLGNPLIQTGIALLGGLLLGYMGVTMIWQTLHGKMRMPRQDETKPDLRSSRLIVLGMVATLSNPFWYAWWTTIASEYLAQARLVGILAVAAFYFGHITANFSWDTFISSIVASGKRVMNDRVYQAIILVCAGFLLYLSLTFLSEGFRSLPI